MNDLRTFIKGVLDTISANRADGKKTAILVRSLTAQLLREESLLLSCLSAVIATIERAGTRWRNPPLYVAQDRSVAMRIFYWPAGYGNDAHLHRSWTVTGVLYNEIVAETYRRPVLSDPMVLGPSDTFVAHAGETGFLLPPCVHRLYNPSKRDSATLHIFAADEHDTVLSDAPRQTMHDANKAATRSSVRERALSVMCGMLGGMKERGAVCLLSRIFALGSLEIKLQALEALTAHDVNLAALKGRELEARVEGHDKDRLSKINAHLPSSLPS